MSLKDHTTCALCLVDFIDGDEVRTVHPTEGLVFPTSHIFPDGKNAFGGRIRNVCRERHDEPHIHEKCIHAWEDKFNVKTPETREEAAKMAGIRKFSIFGITKEEYDLDDVKAVEAIMASGMECPADCPHILSEHEAVTAQVIKCKLCDCEF